MNTRVFVSYNTGQAYNKYEQFALQLIDDLRAAGADVATDGGSISDATFVQTMNKEFPTCRWFVLVESPEALQSPRIQMMVNTVINLVAQHSMSGAFRVLAEPTQPHDVPPTWARLRSIDATRAYPIVRDQLLTALQLKSRSPHTTISSTKTTSSRISTPTAYDRPIAVPRRPFFRSWKGVGLLALIAFLLVGLVGSFMLHALASPTQITTSVPSLGTIHFTSTGIMDTANTKGVDDGIQVDLSHLAQPPSGKSYYGWLLADVGQVNINPTFLGKLPVQQGIVHFKYINPTNTNLLEHTSRFLITENDTDVPPGSVADTTQWRYYAAIPQIQSPVSNMSLLDLLRHLIVSDPKLLNVSLHGGLNIWLLQNSRKILEWSTAARGTGQPQDPQLMHRHFVRILDYLDSTAFVGRDVPAGTPIISDPIVAQVALLTSDAAHQDPPGYVDSIAQYLHDLVDAPGITKDQQHLALTILKALMSVKENLEQVHQDAKKLVQMSDAQLLNSATISLLDDLVAHANSAYAGTTDANTGAQQSGTTWIYYAIQSLTSLQVVQYKTQ